MLWLPSSSCAFVLSPPPYCNRRQMMTHDMLNRHCSDGYFSYQKQRHRTVQQHLQLSATQSDKDNNDDNILSKRSKRKRPTSNSNNQSTYQSSISTSTSTNRATFSTALCIIPPDNTWDTIQKARHLARDTTFYKWPPSIRLFHPFAPKYEISNLVGELANWLDAQNDDLYGTEFEGIFDDEYEVLLDDGMLVRDTISSSSISVDESNNNDILSSFEITLDSIQILPHFEVLDARLEALESKQQIPKQQMLDISNEEREYQKRKAEGKKLIDEQIAMGKRRKKERERKKRLKQRLKMIENGEIDPYDTVNSSSGDVVEDTDTSDTEDATTDTKKNSYNGPCVIYLSPNDESRIKLTTLRERLRSDLFPMYDPFSPSSSVSPYPEQLPRRRPGRQGVKQQQSTMDEEKEIESQFKPLLPIARFATVSEAVKVAKILQQTWDPLTFNVTDLQFISRDDDSDSFIQQQHGSSSGIGFGSTESRGSVGEKQQQRYESDIDDIPEVRHRRKHGTLSTSSASSSHQRMALTTSGEVEDISKQGIYGCDAMVMLLGEEPEESIMDEEASLTMVLNDDVDDDEEEEVGIGNESSDELFRLDDAEEQEETNTGKINYNEIFTTAEREYQRMQAHEELSTASYVGDVPIFDESVTDIEAWLDEDDSDVDDDGATVVIGRAQFFMGAMREFIGMPASSAIDSKNRIMSGGVNALSRRKGAVHRATHESWEEGDYGSR